ncbi:hypothetical protein CC80DRAFT_502592 [Byssothecium circinans]|uniref:Uncharacterized protein n=1 Tax=Byssothecium circinans TaxID=147558 RepID=A0A6A5U3W6_9PLEO|nr:hypothetical protein CC80DRAFT_502592 [Byssothecium circinans]
MRFALLVSAAAFAGKALSVPLLPGERGLWVYMTTEPKWGDHIRGFRQLAPILGLDKCVNLRGTVFDKSISSFGPGKSQKCIVYDDYNCRGKSEPIWYSGYAEMGWNQWDNRISSYQCGYCTTGKDEGCLDTIG